MLVGCIYFICDIYISGMYIVDEVTRDYVEKANVNGLVRKLMLLPWRPDDMTHLSYDQSEKSESFFMVRSACTDAMLYSI